MDLCNEKKDILYLCDPDKNVKYKKQCVRIVVH